MPDDGKQQVILYDGPDGETVVYTTAYCQEQVREQIVACASRHGRRARVRSVLADHYPPEALG